VKKSFNIQELLQHKSRCDETKLMHPSSSSFPKTPRTQSETPWFGGSHSYKTKQNKLPCFTHTFGNMNELLFMDEVDHEDAIIH
jgi:hypothetical protein